MLKAQIQQRPHKGEQGFKRGRGRGLFPVDVKLNTEVQKLERNATIVAQMRTNLQICVPLALSSPQWVFYAPAGVEVWVKNLRCC